MQYKSEFLVQFVLSSTTTTLDNVCIDKTYEKLRLG